jgi:LPXTG-motif cell wall-anchored protein
MGVHGARGVETDSVNNQVSTTSSLRRGLPVTGGDVLLPLELAAGALASGLLLTFAKRRRHKPAVR